MKLNSDIICPRCGHRIGEELPLPNSELDFRLFDSFDEYRTVKKKLFEMLNTEKLC